MATAPNQLWVADVTYVPTVQGWLYLACVTDVFRRMVIGWSMASHRKTDLVIDAVTMAVQRRGGHVPGVIHHSGRGGEYSSYQLERELRRHGVLASMGSVADCYDNALAESLFATIECELFGQQPRGRFESRRDAKLAVFDYLETFYNRAGGIPPSARSHPPASNASTLQAKLRPNLFPQLRGVRESGSTPSPSEPRSRTWAADRPRWSVEPTPSTTPSSCLLEPAVPVRPGPTACSSTSASVPAAQDDADPLAAYRDLFVQHPDVVSDLDGNSLGRPLLATRDAMGNFVDEASGGRLIRAWDEQWMEASTQVGDTIGRVVPGRRATSDGGG